MAQNDQYYPPAAFYFEVTTRGASAGDAAFQEVSGLEREVEYEELREGGQNLYTYRVPKRTKHPNLVLKRGLVAKSSALADWAEETITSVRSKPIELKEVQVKLLGTSGQPLVWWTFADAYPVKWITGPLNAMESALAVETLELTYSWVKREIGSSDSQGGS